MRDYVDARLSSGEFLLPSLVVILAHHLLGSVLADRHAALPRWPMYVFIWRSSSTVT